MLMMKHFLTEYKDSSINKQSSVFFTNHNRLAMEMNLGVYDTGIMDKQFHCDPRQLHLTEHLSS